MSVLADLKVLYHLACKPVRGADHAQRMENFYAGQAGAYDDFRRRLLQGRAALYQAIAAPPGGVWVDLGGGTGSNLEYLADRIARLRHVYVVDLAESLLNVAEERCRQRGWSNVTLCPGDATRFRPREPVDVVTFSYSLTMMPDWFAAIQNAVAMLRPGGWLGVVDFYVSRKYPSSGLTRHGWLTRSLWPLWFANDNVFPSADHLPFLQHQLVTERLEERRAKIPYLPWVRAPYYLFVGRKEESSAPTETPRARPA
jgi:S-adenosylmethionine-diacylgycerolhomoserine-N-methlytransferase